MKVRNAAFLFATLIFGLFVSMGISLIHMTNLLDREAKNIAAAGQSIDLAQELKSYLLIHNRNIIFYSPDADTDIVASSRAEQTEIPHLLTALKKLANSPEEKEALDELEIEISSYFQKQHQLKVSDLAPVDQYTEIRGYVDRTHDVADKVIEINKSQMKQIIAMVDHQNRMADRIAFFMATLSGLLLVGLLAMMFINIAHPLKVVAGTISKFGSGDPAVRAVPRGLHEIRQIASNFNSMARNLAEKQQEQLRFIAAIAHDLRNPLNSMSMASEVLVRKSAPEDRKLANIILRQVKNLDRMVGDLLDTTRIESGHIDLNISSHNIGLLIDDCVKLHSSITELHRFETEIPEEPLFCECDRGRIAQVLNNLISNAVKYSPNGGVVTVKAWDDGQAITVSVSDQGIGIAAEEMDSIFRPFQRSKATRGTIPGIGLGLSASRHIIEAHGGRLNARGNPEGGATFFFTLPAQTLGPELAQPPPAIRAGSPEGERPATHHRVRLDQPHAGR
ncbi:MAG TPA: ATP-binding protein [Gammaproteobacteria bacterium]|nr:ATP-binding protein [Gammaproteobacteria bacterium]